MRVKFFAGLKEQVGHTEICKEIGEGCTVKELWTILREDYPQLPAAEVRLLYAVNRNYVTGDYVLQDLDEVVFVPPVSGG